jgi:hypothetical protein
MPGASCSRHFHEAALALRAAVTDEAFDVIWARDRGIEGDMAGTLALDRERIRELFDLRRHGEHGQDPAVYRSSASTSGARPS